MEIKLAVTEGAWIEDPMIRDMRLWPSCSTWLEFIPLLVFNQLAACASCRLIHGPRKKNLGLELPRVRATELLSTVSILKLSSSGGVFSDIFNLSAT